MVSWRCSSTTGYLLPSLWDVGMPGWAAVGTPPLTCKGMLDGTPLEGFKRGLGGRVARQNSVASITAQGRGQQR